MKPEPLKDKIMYVEELPYKYPNGKDVDVCQVCHIKSAVEWLKERACSCEDSGKGGEKCEACKDIDEAFEDVVKNG